MLATFCVRLAFGLIAALLLFPHALVNPRFFRTHFLTVLGLSAAAAAWLWRAESGWHWTLAVSILLSGLGSLAWSIDGAPGGRILIFMTTVALGVTLGCLSVAPAVETHAARATVQNLADEFTSAAVLGVSTTAMLMGHSYLIAPSMSLTPLLRLLAGLLVALTLRLAVSAAEVLFWTARHSPVNLTDEALLWLPVRWLVGFAVPLVLGWMAWESAKIRSTQSATGILYVVVICCFLGELISQVISLNERLGV